MKPRMESALNINIVSLQMKYLNIKQPLHKRKGWSGPKPKKKNLIQYNTKNFTKICLHIEPYYQLNLLVFKKGNITNTIQKVLHFYGERFILSHNSLSLYFSCRGFSFNVELQTHPLTVTMRMHFLVPIFWGAQEFICIALILMHF